MTKLFMLMLCVGVLCGCTTDDVTTKAPVMVEMGMTAKPAGTAALLKINNGDEYMVAIATGILVTPTEITCHDVFFLSDHVTVHNVSYARDQIGAFWPIESGVWPVGKEATE